MKKFILLTGSLTLALGVSIAISAGAPVGNIFQGGQPAIAADVNANFQELADRLDAIPKTTTYDYRDYLTTASSKTFSVASNTYCADSETRSFVRTPNGSDTDVEVTHRGYTGLTPCNHRVFHSTNTPTERLLKSKDVYYVGGINDGLLNHTSRLDDPITVRTSTMNKGQSFTDASTTYKKPAGGVDALDGIHIQTTYASGLEDITVAAGSYTNCLKVYVTRNSQGFGGSTDSRVSWHCPNNVGMVKRIRYRLGTEYRVYELQSINF